MSTHITREPSYEIFRGGEIEPGCGSPSQHFLGIGVFESVFVARGRSGPWGRDIDRHIERLVKSAKRLEIEAPTPQELKTLLSSCFAHTDWRGHGTARVRVVLRPDEHFVIFEPISYPSDDLGAVRLLPLVAEREFPEVKSCAALVSWWSNATARKAGFDEALLIDRAGIVREGSWSNFFWFDREDRLCTAGEGVLNGITARRVRECAADLHEVIEGDLSLEQFQSSATEAFVTSAFRGIVPVAAVGETRLDTAAGGSSRTHALARRYHDRVERTAL